MRGLGGLAFVLVGLSVAVACGSNNNVSGTTNGGIGGKAGTGGKGGTDGGAGTGGSTGTGATGSGATGSGATGSGATGSGATAGTGGVAGGGATGTGATGTGGVAGGGATGTGATGSGATGATGSGATGGTGTGGGGGCYQATCQGHLYACGNCLDDDGDGLIDMADPDCLGPCHNSESVYYGSIPGQNNAPCKMDCYFDQDTGAGNDDCYWNHECDPLEIAPNYPPEGSGCKYDPKANTPGTNQNCSQLYATQSSTCESYCGPLTPNGCDCFGCCELPAGGGNYVWLGSTVNGVGTCSLQTVADPNKCKPCTPVKGCLNTCLHCELCLGKTTLPPDCLPTTGGGGGGTTGGGGTPGGGGTTSGGGGTTSGGGGTTSGGGGTTSGGGGTTSGGGGTTGGGGTGGVCVAPLCAPNVQPCGVPCLPGCPLGYFCNTGCCISIPK